MGFCEQLTIGSLVWSTSGNRRLQHLWIRVQTQCKYFNKTQTDGFMDGIKWADRLMVGLKVTAYKKFERKKKILKLKYFPGFTRPAKYLNQISFHTALVGTQLEHVTSG